MPRRENLHSIRDWATTSFSDDFAKLDIYLKVSNFTFSQFRSRAGRTSLSQFKAVKVGTTKSDGTLIYAWRGRDSFNVGHEVEESRLQPHDDLTDPQITFVEPFCWISPTENEVTVARFETIVHYLLLMVKPTAYMTKKIDFFKEHFPGACRDVVEGLDSQLEAAQAPTDVPRTLRSTTVMNSSAHIAPQRLRTPATPTLASNEHISSLDQSFTSFRASMLAKAGQAQLASQREIADLNAQIQDLRSRLAKAEKEQEDIKIVSAQLSAKNIDFASELTKVAQEKVLLKSQRSVIDTKLIVLEAKLKGAEKEKTDLRKERMDLTSRIAAKDAETRRAKNKAEEAVKRADRADKIASAAGNKADAWKVQYEKLKKDVLDAVSKQA